MNLILKFRFLFFLLLGSHILGAQSLDLFVVASAGDNYNKNNLSLTTTLGEWMTETLSSENYILTQGFQQSRLTLDTWLEDTYIEWEVKVFPNPVEEILHIKLYGDYQGRIKIELFDMKGRKIMVNLIEKPINNMSHQLDLTSFANGFYLLKISTNDLKYNKITRIEIQ